MIPIFLCFELFLKLFQKLCFSQNFVSLYLFRLIEYVFQSIEIVFKNFCEPLCVSIIRNYFSINRKSYGMFFKKLSFRSDKHFFKKFFAFSLSIRLGQGSLTNFCRFRPFFLQGFPLPRPVRPLYPSLCIYFHVFMHKLMHFVGIFGPFQNWDFC